ncbi:MAG: DEAD/DEAH box helicase [Polyangiaceae bacterium]
MTTSTPLASFHPAVTEWFEETLGTPTLAQKKAWPPIGALESTLLLAPTGSGKTLAAFLAAIDRVMTTRAKGTGTRVLYVSPMKALAMDVEKNLRAPIAGIANVAERMGIDVHVPTVDVRTGDTSQKDRLRMRKHPPDVLITTPESLYLLLTSAARETLTDVETVIVDEIHSIVPTKRGAHLFLSLERLEAIRRSKKPLQRIGLSATQKPLDEVARLLGGFVGKKPRPVTLVDANAKRPLELRVEVPDLDMATVGTVDELASGPAARGGARRSVWPKLHEELVAEIRKHRTTMIFVNSRRLAERLASALNDVAGEEIALAHHGSIAKDKRLVLEDRLKRGELKSIVATSSLELGIDIGSVDKVVQIEAPMSVASGLQRVGRANHEVGGVPAGLLVPKHRGDLLACAAAAKRMKDGAVEETFYPRNPLDVLAQQIVATLSVGPTTADALFALVRGAAPFAELPRSAFDEVLELLSGRYPSDRFVELRARVVWDRVRGTVRAKDGAVRVAVTNGGTIPDRGLFGVFLPGEGGSEFGGKRVGELEEEMVHELREGEVFLLGASSWRADRITHERVIVTPATGEPGKLPFWRGGGIGRAKAFGEAVGQLTRKVADLPDAEARKLLVEEHFTEPRATDALIAYVREQVERAGAAPTDRTIVFERYTDEIGDFRVCILSPFGGRVHAPWATAVAARIKEVHGGAVETVWTDDGIVFRLPASDTPPDPKDFFPDPEDVEPTLVRCLTGTALFASLFREAAGRALLLPKKSPHKRQPLWATRKRAADLLTVAVDYPRFPLLLETFRECLHDAFDLPGLVDVLGKVRSRKIKVATVDSRTPSPFATTLTFSFVANFIYDPDAPAAERRSQALLVDWQELRNLLGEAELRTLLDPDVVRETEDRLIGRTHAPRSPDALHDLLLRVGDLGDADLDARSTDDAPLRAWAAELERERRVVRARVAGTWTTFAAEDAAVYRDALGVALPEGLPSSFTGPRADALVELLRRHARTRGPFTKESVAARFDLGVGTVLRELEVLVRTGALAKGAFLPDGTEDEYCDAEVLRTIKQRSLARLREGDRARPVVGLRAIPHGMVGRAIPDTGSRRAPERDPAARGMPASRVRPVRGRLARARPRIPSVRSRRARRFRRGGVVGRGVARCDGRDRRPHPRRSRRVARSGGTSPRGCRREGHGEGPEGGKDDHHEGSRAGRARVPGRVVLPGDREARRRIPGRDRRRSLGTRVGRRSDERHDRASPESPPGRHHATGSAVTEGPGRPRVRRAHAWFRWRTSRQRGPLVAPELALARRADRDRTPRRPRRIPPRTLRCRDARSGPRGERPRRIRARVRRPEGPRRTGTGTPRLLRRRTRWRPVRAPRCGRSAAPRPGRGRERGTPGALGGRSRERVRVPRAVAEARVRIVRRPDDVRAVRTSATGRGSARGPRGRGPRRVDRPERRRAPDVRRSRRRRETRPRHRARPDEPRRRGTAAFRASSPYRRNGRRGVHVGGRLPRGGVRPLRSRPLLATPGVPCRRVTRSSEPLGRSASRSRDAP